MTKHGKDNSSRFAEGSAHVIASAFTNHVTDYDGTPAAAGCHLPIAYLAAAIPICDLIQFRSLIPHLLTAETLEQLVERLKKKFSIKNTTGYHMGSFWMSLLH